MASHNELVIVKLGGGLITDKESICTPNKTNINLLAQALAKVHAQNIDLIIVHGAGSYGHLKAKKWRLNEGKIDSIQIEDNEFFLSNQREAVESVQKDMIQLNEIVCNALKENGLSPVVHIPHEFITETGEDFKGEIKERFISRFSDRKVDVTFGDVVSCFGDKEFGILSGDDLMYRIATEIEGVTRVVFAIEGVDGLLREPPIIGEEQKLIKEWREGDTFTGSHRNDIDVTGGIFLKIERSMNIIHKINTDILLIRGIPERVISACTGETCIGTRVLPNH